MSNQWIIIGRSCYECGGKLAVQVLDHLPTKEEKDALISCLGGMFCITVYTEELWDEGPTVIEDLI